MNNLPKISLVTATYNGASTLEDTLRSVLAQGYPNLEYIVVDGNSTDHTPQLIERYRPEFGESLVYIREADHGLYDAMNKGFKRATGQVVGLLNADDFFTSPHILQAVAEAFSHHPEVDAVYGDVHYVHASNLRKGVRYYSSRLFRRPLMRLGFMPAHPSFYCRREVYERYGYFRTDYRVAADFELLLRLIYLHRIHTLYLPLDFVTMRTGGVSSSGWQSHRNILRDHRRALRENHVRSCYALMALRYAYKVVEIAYSKMKYR